MGNIVDLLPRDTFYLFTQGAGVNLLTTAGVTDKVAMVSKPIQDDVISWCAIGSSDLSALDAILWGSIDNGTTFNVKVSEIKDADAGWNANSSHGESVANVHTYCTHFYVQVVSMTGTSVKFGIIAK